MTNMYGFTAWLIDPNSSYHTPHTTPPHCGRHRGRLPPTAYRGAEEPMGPNLRRSRMAAWKKAKAYLGREDFAPDLMRPRVHREVSSKDATLLKVCNTLLPPQTYQNGLIFH